MAYISTRFDLYFPFWAAGGAVAFLLGTILTWRCRLPWWRAALGGALVGALQIFVRAASFLGEGNALGTIAHQPGALVPELRVPGSILLCVLAAPPVAWMLGVPVRRFTDMLLTTAFGAIAIGRFGCHFAGCCFGKLTKLPWAVFHGNFTPAHADHMARDLIRPTDPYSLGVHPLALYLVGAAAILTLTMIVLLTRSEPGTPTIVALLGGGLVFGALEWVREVDRVPVPYRQETWFVLAAIGASLYVLRLVATWSRRGATETPAGAIGRAS